MFEAQKQLFEDNMVRSGLTPTPGGWWINKVGTRLEAYNGKCCLLSPTILANASVITGPFLEFLEDTFHVPGSWLLGAIDGFDGIVRATNIYYYDGCRWGGEMRRKFTGSK